jgi:DNA-binding Xre family transcriptional regulator
VRGLRLRWEAQDRELRRVDETGCWAPPGWEELTLQQLFNWRRRFAGMSQRDMTRLSGVAQSQVSRFEGGGDPHWSTLDRLAHALDCELVVRLKPRDPSKGPVR